MLFNIDQYISFFKNWRINVLIGAELLTCARVLVLGFWRQSQSFLTTWCMMRLQLQLLSSAQLSCSCVQMLCMLCGNVCTHSTGRSVPVSLWLVQTSNFVTCVCAAPCLSSQLSVSSAALASRKILNFFALISKKNNSITLSFVNIVNKVVNKVFDSMTFFVFVFKITTFSIHEKA